MIFSPKQPKILHNVNMLFYEILFDCCDDVKVTTFSMIQSNPCVSVAAWSLLILARKTMFFSETSRNIMLADTFLMAEYENIHGEYKYSQINLNYYIANHNGRLTFVREDGHFKNTSRNVQLVGTVLHAECKNYKKEWCSAQLDLDYYFKNINGRLTVCGINEWRHSRCNWDQWFWCRACA